MTDEQVNTVFGKAGVTTNCLLYTSNWQIETSLEERQYTLGKDGVFISSDANFDYSISQTVDIEYTCLLYTSYIQDQKRKRLLNPIIST